MERQIGVWEYEASELKIQLEDDETDASANRASSNHWKNDMEVLSEGASS